MSELLISTLNMVLSILFIGITMAITPYITRKSIQFGVRLPETANTHPDIKKFKKQFLIVNLVLTLIGASFILGGLWPGLTETQAKHFVNWGGSVMIMAYLVISALIYYSIHCKVKVLKQKYFINNPPANQTRIAVATSFRTGHKPLVISNLWLLGLGLAIILVTTIAPVIYYDQIPNQVPVNFSFQGIPVNFTEKSMSVFMMIPITQILLLPIFIIANQSFKGAKQNLQPKNPNVSMEQSQAYRYAWSKFTVGGGIGTLILMAFIQISMMTLVENIRIGFLLIVVGFILYSVKGLYIMIKYGQGGERYHPKNMETKETPYEGIDDDEFWKIGVFYYNPSDLSIFVEKRFGTGITFNYARWQAWALIGGLIVITLALVITPLWLI